MHFATVWEHVSDAIPDEQALICDGTSRTWRELDDRAARLASTLSSYGVGVDSKVGILLHNSNEYVEAQYAIFKVRGCPVNVNYRYKVEELVYLLDNADAQALFYQACYSDLVEQIQPRLPGIVCYVCIDDGTTGSAQGALDYERCIDGALPMARIERPYDDIYMLYTGGTTGMPKGVMYHVGEFCANLTRGMAMSMDMTPPESPAEAGELAARISRSSDRIVSLPACPLMHGTGMWLGTMVPLSLGGTVVTIPRLGFDPDHLWRTVEQHRVTNIVIVGDAFARPMLTALDDAARSGRAYDLSSVRRINSSGVMWSSEVKDGLLRHHDMVLMDSMGSTEGGMGASVATRASGSAVTARFEMSDGVKVFNEDGVEITPGSGEIGILATSGNVPIGYYKDPEKSASTFKEVNGVRYSFPGDYAKLDADGSLILLGRGSQCINTAGEKVFSEEVEEAIKSHPQVNDCLVFGVADDRLGQRVTAVASVLPGASLTAEQVIDHARQHLASYKLPRRLLLVDRVERAANGKADYKWARAFAQAQQG